jgi:hypothetical protein
MPEISFDYKLSFDLRVSIKLADSRWPASLLTAKEQQLETSQNQRLGELFLLRPTGS